MQAHFVNRLRDAGHSGVAVRTAASAAEIFFVRFTKEVSIMHLEKVVSRV